MWEEEDYCTKTPPALPGRSGFVAAVGSRRLDHNATRWSALAFARVTARQSAAHTHGEIDAN